MAINISHKFLIAYLVLAHVFIAYLLVKTDKFNAMMHYLGFSQTNTYIDYYINQSYAFQHFQNQQLKPKANIIVGDSIAKSINILNLSESVINWGIGHNTTELLLNNIDKLSALKSAKNVIFLLGINDLNGKKTAHDVLENYKKLMSSIQSVNNIFIVSITPMHKSHKNAERVNLEVQLLNKLLKNYSREFEHIFFIDTASVLAPSGSLETKFDRGDGLHLNELAYHQITSLLNSKVFIR